MTKLVPNPWVRAALGALAGLLFTAPAAAQAAGPATPVNADRLAWFYNKPGATSDEVTRDHEACGRFGNVMFTGTENPGRANQYGLVGAVMLGMVATGPIANYIDDCMISNGYRRYNVIDKNMSTFAKRLGAMTPQQQAQFVGAANPPEGVLARQWVNAYWLAAASEQQASPAHHYFMPHRVASRVLGKPTRDDIQPVKDGAPIKLGPSESLLVVTMRSVGPQPTNLFFMRDKPETGDPDPADAKGEKWPTIRATSTGDKAGDGQSRTFAFVVPAGSYSLAAAGPDRYASSTFFCLGTAAVRVAPGDVVFLADITVDLGSQTAIPLAPQTTLRIRINPPSLDSARAALPQAPELASKMVAANYVTGAPHACPSIGGAHIAGLDLPGAPMWQP